MRIAGSTNLPRVTSLSGNALVTGATGGIGQAIARRLAAAGATVCGSGTATAADVDPEDYKRVVVAVRWGKHRTQQSTLIANPGSSAGPAVTNLTMNSDNPVTAKVPSSLTLAFTATTSRPPAAVNWSIDGDPQGTASGSGTSWTFNWALGNFDDQNSPTVE